MQKWRLVEDERIRKARIIMVVKSAFNSLNAVIVSIVLLVFPTPNRQHARLAQCTSCPTSIEYMYKVSIVDLPAIIFLELRSALIRSLSYVAAVFSRVP